MTAEDPPRLRDGTIITDEMAQRFADEAEAGYDIENIDPSRIHRRARGERAAQAERYPQSPETP